MRQTRRLAGVLLAAALALPAAAAEAAPDPWITTQVKMALLTSDRVDGLDVNVDTVGGRVTLHGTVETAEQKAQAEATAREVEGVKDVRNLLQVAEADERAEATRVSDDALREQVATVLDRDQALDDGEIEVASVNDGVVILSGRAATLSDHRRALEDARSVEGVRRVASEIESPDELGDAEIWSEGKPGAERSMASSASDMWITSKAKVALITDPDAPGLGINVDTRDGVVTLFGTVTSEEAKQSAEAQVRELDGVKGVENELQVVPEGEQARVARSDDQVREDLERRLSDRSDLQDASVDVAVADGVARLTGTVQGQVDRLTVLGLAGDTQGVRSVIDDLRVEAASDVAAPPPEPEEAP